VEYFSSIRTLALSLEVLGEDCTMLVQLLESEQERGRFSHDDIHNAAATLGFGADGPLKVEYGSDVPDEFVENAWKECVKKSWREYEGGSKLQAEATKALKIIAGARGSRTLQKVWEHGKHGMMSPERAYDTLEVPKDVDEDMLITVFSMRASCMFLSWISIHIDVF
jgi:ubiquitin carboxyl-terminal hydrolase 25/28